jgi:hypothetical protein
MSLFAIFSFEIVCKARCLMQIIAKHDGLLFIVAKCIIQFCIFGKHVRWLLIDPRREIRFDSIENMCCSHICYTHLLIIRPCFNRYESKHKSLFHHPITIALILMKRQQQQQWTIQIVMISVSKLFYFIMYMYALTILYIL